ncbi:MAG: hypothetical protein LUE31_08010, partial [Lachnospiraceae bacterium]|nr:hypothetical protein [Lachnospiraceae bacterium]
MCKAGKNPARIHRICIIASQKARNDLTEVGEYLDTSDLCFVKKQCDGSVFANAVDFYRERIRQYILGKESAHVRPEDESWEVIERLNRDARETAERGG